MSELEHRGGEQQAKKQLFVAMRTPDRRELISPTSLTPDFFQFDDFTDARPSIESRVQGLMRTHAGVTVNSDHLLRSPEGEANVRGYAVYRSKTVDESLAQDHHNFSVHDVRGQYHDLQALSNDETTFTQLERRTFRIKAELFRQVLNLFDGKSTLS